MVLSHCHWESWFRRVSTKQFGHSVSTPSPSTQNSWTPIDSRLCRIPLIYHPPGNHRYSTDLMFVTFFGIRPNQRGPTVDTTQNIRDIREPFSDTLLDTKGFQKRYTLTNQEWLQQSVFPTINPWIDQQVHMRPGHHWLCEFGDEGDGQAQGSVSSITWVSCTCWLPHTRIGTTKSWGDGT